MRLSFVLHMHRHICSYNPAHRPVHIHSYTYTYAHIYIYICTHTHMFLYTPHTQLHTLHPCIEKKWETKGSFKEDFSLKDKLAKAVVFKLLQ